VYVQRAVMLLACNQPPAAV